MRRASLASAMLLAGSGACSLTSVPDLSSGRGASPADGGAAVDGGAGADALVAGDSGETGYRALVLASTPMAYYRFEEAAGVVAHDERGAFDATYGAGVVLGGVGFVSGSRAARLTLAGAAITGPSGFFDIVDRQPFTFEAWVSPHTFPSEHGTVFFKADGTAAGFREIGAYVTAPGSLVFERFVAGQELTVTASLAADRFTHVALTYDGTDLRMYLDGALAGSKTDTRLMPPKSQPIAFGFDPPDKSQFDGALDEVALYDRALSAAEIALHAKATTP